MRIPKKIIIYGQEIEVAIEKLEDAHGLFSSIERKITLHKELKLAEKKQTFLHECFHGVLSRTGITSGLQDGIEEAIVDSIATFMVETFDLKVKKK